MGMCWVLKEGVEEDCNIFKEDQLDYVKELVSMPFSVDFFVPVVKVICGDAFSGLLTAEGQVHTWGYNHYGALGIDNEQAIL